VTSWRMRRCILAFSAAMLSSTVSAEVYFSDATFEVSSAGTGVSRNCIAILKPTQTSGDVLAPRLLVATSGQSRLSFGVEGPARYSGLVLVQDNMRRPFAGSENASIEEFRASGVGKAIASGRLFFVTAQRGDNGNFASSRYERINFDAILAKIESLCPFDAESLMTDLSPREKAERALSVSKSDLTLIRWALNKKYGDITRKPEPRSLSLSQMERGYLRRYAAENRLPISRYLTRATMRLLTSEGRELERLELAAQEERRYSSARGNPHSLRAYVNSCEVCAFKDAAENEIKELERKEAADHERRTYDAARGDIERLNAYVRDCRVCDFETTARNEIRELEEEQRRNPAVTFQIKSNHPNTVALSFRSSTDSSRAWPGGGQVYVLKDWTTQRYRLSCQPGEKICYGAWVDGGPLSPYWGAGYMGRENCQNCCFTCPTGETAPFVLEPRDAKHPIPTITWKVRSDAPYSVAVAFYSSTRPGHYWPGNGNVWLIDNPSVHTYKLTCLSGEKICYGAWPEGNSTSYWGAGHGGHQGCTGCCRTCDGSETSVIVLNP